ncbi:YbfB/YjiJ family MFS transporter [Undibacterium terreum]|uniref:MFS transporter n=1 Tax=Undibacterium terreum TaxID=1224302 RepID=A0A916U2A5_9BURK|nr:YbfB/YjiJ family MFS transporter [Undibacterium terreum]GGC57978.1 MFS transporter [Undibacterium terreum]
MISIIDTVPLRRGSTSEIFVAIGLSIGAAVSLGFSRFAYALLLPAMRESLHWTYVEAGGMNTANAVGYVIGAAAGAWFSKRLGIKTSFLVSLALSGQVLLLTGLVDSYNVLMLLRFIGGLTTAVTFVVGVSLAAGVAPDASPARSSLLLAIYITGVGSGIVISGLLIPPILAKLGASGWEHGWLYMGFIAILAMVPAIAATRAVPEQLSPDSGVLPMKEAAFLWPTFISYALFGAGYVSYMTFIIVLIRQSGSSALYAAGFWIVLGMASVIGTLLWGRVLTKMREGVGAGVVAIVVLFGTLPTLIWPSLSAAFVSAIIFGGSFMAGPTAVTVMVRKLLAPKIWTAAISALTVAFAVGQAVGPLLSGYVSDMTGSVSAGLWISPVLLIASAIAAVCQKARQ